jgi:hypothetical protein
MIYLVFIFGFIIGYLVGVFCERRKWEDLINDSKSLHEAGFLNLDGEEEKK